MIGSYKFIFLVTITLVSLIVLPWWQQNGLSLKKSEAEKPSRELTINKVKPRSIKPSNFLEKPIFSESRQPATSTTKIKSEFKKANLLQTYKYRGTVIDGSRKAIILENNGTTIQAELGYDIDGWQLVKIELGEIILSNGSKTINLLEKPTNKVKDLRNKKRETRWLPALKSKE